MSLHRPLVLVLLALIACTGCRSTDALFASGVRDELAAQRTTDAAERNRRNRRARDAYARVLERLPGNSPTLSNRANVELALGETSAAVADLREAVNHADVPDIGFYLRRLGDALAADHRPYESGHRYWQALEWDPHDIETHQRVLQRLVRAPEIQITNYYRFLLENRKTLRILAADEVLLAVADRADMAAVTAAGLDQAALVVRPEELERIAEPFLARSGQSGVELRAVLRGQSTTFSWLAAHDAASATTDRPPHAAFRALSHVLGKAAAVRGDIARAERQHRLATQMPGADFGDWAQLMEFYDEYKPQNLRPAIEEVERSYIPRHPNDEIPFHTAAITAYALLGVCGDFQYGVRYHWARLLALGAEPPAIGSTACPVVLQAEPPPTAPAADCGFQCPILGISDREAHGTLLTIPVSLVECCRDHALDLVAADYHPESMPPLVIEAALPQSAPVAAIRQRLIDRGVPAGAIRTARSEWRGPKNDAIRLRFDVPRAP